MRLSKLCMLHIPTAIGNAGKWKKIITRYGAAYNECIMIQACVILSQITCGASSSVSATSRVYLFLPVTHHYHRD